MAKLCVINNIAPLYREEIHMLMDSFFDIDWYFGENKLGIKEYDIGALKNSSRYKVCGNPNKISWKRNLRTLFNNKYNTYFLHFETRAVSDWIWILLKTIFFRKKRVYTWAHGWYGKESKIETIMKLWLYKRLTGIFVYGQYAKNLIVQKGIPEEKIFVIHNSLHYSEQLKIRKNIKRSNIYKKYFKNDNPVIIFIGRLTAVKRLDILIQAVAKLKDKGEMYNVIFVGDGVMRHSLELLATKNKIIDSIWFYGQSYDEGKNAELLYNADLCVAPGNIGLTAIHALMFGCPAISHNDFKWQMPEFETIHSGRTGDFFEYGKITELANSISKWFSEKKEKREEVRQACYNVIDTEWNPFFQINVLKNHLKIL